MKCPHGEPGMSVLRDIRLCHHWCHLFWFDFKPSLVTPPPRKRPAQSWGGSCAAGDPRLLSPLWRGRGLLSDVPPAGAQGWPCWDPPYSDPSAQATPAGPGGGSTAGRWTAGLAGLSSARAAVPGTCNAGASAPAAPGLTQAWAWHSAHCRALWCRAREEGRPMPTFRCVRRRPPSCPTAPMTAAPWSSPRGSSCCCRRCSGSCGMKGTVCSSSPR